MEDSALVFEQHRDNMKFVLYIFDFFQQFNLFINVIQFLGVVGRFGFFILGALLLRFCGKFVEYFGFSVGLCYALARVKAKVSA